MAKITENTRKEVSEVVYQFFAEECEVDMTSLHDGSKIISDLGGDSLMLLELIEIFKKKYNLDIDLKTVGKYTIKHPVETIGQLIDTQMLIIEHENRLTDIQK